MSIFSTRADRSTIEARIADTEKQIATAEAALLAIMMQAAIADDGSADEAVAKLAAFQSKRATLDKAMLQVEQDEQDALDKARSAADKSRQRAISQHKSKLERDARSVQDLIGQLLDACAVRSTTTIARQRHSKLGPKGHGQRS